MKYLYTLISIALFSFCALAQTGNPDHGRDKTLVLYPEINSSSVTLKWNTSSRYSSYVIYSKKLSSDIWESMAQQSGMDTSINFNMEAGKREE